MKLGEPQYGGLLGLDVYLKSLYSVLVLGYLSKLSCLKLFFTTFRLTK